MHLYGRSTTKRPGEKVDPTNQLSKSTSQEMRNAVSSLTPATRDCAAARHARMNTRATRIPSRLCSAKTVTLTMRLANAQKLERVRAEGNHSKSTAPVTHACTRAARERTTWPPLRRLQARTIILFECHRRRAAAGGEDGIAVASRALSVRVHRSDGCGRAQPRSGYF